MAPKRTNTAQGQVGIPGMVIPAKIPLLASYGSTGLKEYSGYIFEEFLEKLRGRDAVRVYREMADNDPIVGAVVFACQMMLRQADWRVEPADESDKADQAKEFVEEVMEDMSHSWAEFVEECVTFLPYGFSLFEPVYKIRGGNDTKDPTRKSKYNDGRIGLRKLAPRSQDSVLRWLFDVDTGDLLGVEQLTEVGRHALIPHDRLLIFRTESKKNNPEGRSILRNSFVPYMRKKAVEDAEGRAALRAAGVVELRIPGRMMSPDADEQEQATFAQFKALANTLARDQQGAVVLPSDRNGHGEYDYDFNFKIGDGRRPTDFSQVIRRFDEAIATSVLADFILLGQSQGMHGSHAMSTDKTDVFSQALNSYLKGMEEVLNRHLLPRLWDLNGFDQEVMPQIKAEPVEVPDLATLAQYITALAAAGARMFPDDDLEEHLREIADMPPVAPTAQAGTPQVQVQQQTAENSNDIAQQQLDHTKEQAQVSNKLQQQQLQQQAKQPAAKKPTAKKNGVK